MSVPRRAEGALIDAAAARRPACLAALSAPAGPVAVLAPHPDDETLGAGGAIAAALHAGRTVIVVLLTAGEMSHAASRTHQPARMGAVRLSEFARALGALSAGAPGIVRCRFLGLRDGAVPATGPGATAAATTLAATIRAVGARTLWSPFPGDPHRDHEAAAAIADGAVRRLAARGEPVLARSYAVWGRFGDAGASVDPARILPRPPGRQLGAKARAMAAHASQLTPLVRDDPDGFVMPRHLVRHFARHPEIFVVPEGDAR